MLSAFTARPIVELRARDKFKIEAILAHGDRLLVGLSTGSLRIYRVNEIPEQNGIQNGGKSPRIERPCTPTRQNQPSGPKPVDLLRELEKFSTKSIEQLAIIKEANALISLSNTYVSIHDLHSYALQEQLVKTKGASTFAITSNIIKDTDTGVPEIISRLAVAVKRRLLLWSWHESEQSPDITEITLPSAIRTLTWASATKIICGLNSGYLMVDVVTQEVEDIVGPGAIGGAPGTEGGRFGGVGSVSMGYMGLGSYVPKPLATRLSDGEIVLAKDINSLFIDSDGKPKEKRQIPWASAPDSIGYSYPYMIALQTPSKGAVEVRNPETLSLLQTIPLPNASQLHFPPSTVSLAHAGKGFHVVSERCVWRMAATDYDTQIDELVDSARYDEAISILEMLEDALLKNKTERLREIKMLKAQYLFDRRKYRQAIDLFSDEHVQAPPERVIRLYPPIIAGELSTFVNRTDSNETAETSSVNGDVPALAPEIMGSPKPGAVNKVLKQHKKQLSYSDNASIRSSKKGDNNEGSPTASIKNGKPSDDLPLEGKDLKEAVMELRSFLAQSRVRMQRFLDFETGRLRPEATGENGGVNGSSKEAFDSLLVAPSSEADVDREQKLRETAILVDTTLFRAYMFVSPSLAPSLFRIHNFCDPDVVNEKLLENGGYNDLVDFLHGKKLHRPALELLAKFGQAEKEDDDDALPTSSLHGPQRTVGYLQNLPPEMIDLILEFAEWPLRADPKLGMEIFVADTENAETLPRDRVAKFLGDIDIDLEVRYLEHVIEELNDLTPDFHNRLVAAYLQELKARNDRETESWRELMERLLAFLRGSKQYSLSRAFGLIPRDDSAFYEAQAVVLSNMGQHKQALEIYVFKIKDFEKAEEYCNSIHIQSTNPSSPVTTPISSPSTSNGLRTRSSTSISEDTPSIYHTLLSLYLTPPPPHPINFEPALSLLSKHGARLPASSTLSLIPSSLPISKLESYFQGRIRAANSIVNESRIVAGLRKSEVVAAQAMLRLGDAGTIDIAAAAGLKKAGVGKGRNRRVVVGEERVCGGCFKRLGGSVIVALPDNSVVHYGCLNRVNGAGRRESMNLGGGGGGSGGMEALRRGGRG